MCVRPNDFVAESGCQSLIIATLGGLSHGTRGWRQAPLDMCAFAGYGCVSSPGPEALPFGSPGGLVG